MERSNIEIEMKSTGKIAIFNDKCTTLQSLERREEKHDAKAAFVALQIKGGKIMKRMKKYTALILALAMILLLAACSSPAATSAPTTSAPTTSAQSAAQTGSTAAASGAAQSSAPAAGSDEIFVGFSLPTQSIERWVKDGENMKALCDKEGIKLVTQMLNRYPAEKHIPAETILRVSDWTVAGQNGRNILDHISFEAKRGEILGIAGLMGAGRTELATSLMGAFGTRVSGTIEIEGKTVQNATPAESVQNGMSYVSEDRKRFGLVLGMDIKDNICLPNFRMIQKGFSIDEYQKTRYSEKYCRELQIKTPFLEQKVKNLSGGNQQKVVLAKWMMSRPKILIFDEPTRGIDVGAKYEIYCIMNDLVKQGLSIIMISSELPEVLGMSDRILVMSEGRITAEYKKGEASPDLIMKAATAARQSM